MGDLLAGTTVMGDDTPPTVNDTEPGSYTFTNTAYGVTTTGGTYADCGVAFVAPTTGRVEIHYGAQVSNSSASGATQISPYVRTGGTVGAGSDVTPAADANRMFLTGTGGGRCGEHLFLSGLTPGSTYNVRLEHKTTAATTGTALHRNVTVKPAT